MTAEPGVRAEPWPRGRPLNVHIQNAPQRATDPALDARVRTRWSALTAANPRFFDGPILSVVRCTPGEPIACRRDRYSRLAVQPEVETGVRQLSVTALVIDRRTTVAPRLLLCQRGHTTRLHGGMWELGPAGGIDPPPEGVTTLTEADLAGQLGREAEEEIGAAFRLNVGEVAALCHDDIARSIDIVFRCEPVGVSDPAQPTPPNWEYESTRWIPLADLSRFARENRAAIIPATLAILRLDGLV